MLGYVKTIYNSHIVNWYDFTYLTVYSNVYVEYHIVCTVYSATARAVANYSCAYTIHPYRICWTNIQINRKTKTEYPHLFMHFCACLFVGLLCYIHSNMCAPGIVIELYLYLQFICTIHKVYQPNWQKKKFI